MACRKLLVEVVDAQHLLPKDGMGTSSPYVVVDFDGQRKKTSTIHRNLNPTWNETLEFTVSDPKNMVGEFLEADVYHDKRVGPTRRSNFLGRIRLKADGFVRKGEEALMYFPLEKKSFFNWVQGDIGLKIYYVDEPPPPPPPPPEPETAPMEPPSAETPAVPNAENPVGAESTVAPQPETAPPIEPSETPPPPPPPPPDQPQPENILAAEKPPEEAPPIPSQPPESGTGDPPIQPPTETEATPVPGPPPEMASPPPSIPMDEIKTTTGFDKRRQILRPTQSDVYSRDLSGTLSGVLERSSYDMVEKMQYLFVRIVRARSLAVNTESLPPTVAFVQIAVAAHNVRSKTARKTAFSEWDQIFAFDRETLESASTLEISVWDQPESGMDSQNFLGGVCFDLSEIPVRDPPDSPLAPQWYRLEGGGATRGDVMLAVWFGTQADESFPDAWKSDTAGALAFRSKVYISPKLWYLRATVIEAQDLPSRFYPEGEILVRVQLGFQVLKTRVSTSRNDSPFWNEDLMFVAAEPFEEQLVFFLENRSGKETTILGFARLPLTSIERRVDGRKVVSRWFNLEVSGKERSYKGRLHLRLCFDGGYHVMDESAHLSSDFRPTARQLWKPPIGTVELGLIGCRNLLPMKTKAGKGTTDAYSVAKYGPKWVRTRTITDSLDPRWNEQYTWHVYDTCTVLTIGVFDNWHIYAGEEEETKTIAKPDFRIGKIRIRISTLKSNTVYRNVYPLLLLSPTGVRKMGEIELAVRFARDSALDVLHTYTQPLLPPMHYLHPIGVLQLDALRHVAARIVAARLSRAEPPLRREVISYVLDTDSHTWSMRRVKANWFRILHVLSGIVNVFRWLDDTCEWKNPMTTILLHFLLLMLVWYPDLIVPTLSFYLFAIGAWHYRFRPCDPSPHMCVKISQADVVDREELDEEFDTVPSTRPLEVVRARYDRLRTLAARVQTVLGDFATQGERVQALITWRDPRATGIFVGTCFLASLALYVVPLKMVVIAYGFYYLRHPMFRDPMPPPAVNFFRRLPALSDRIM